MKHLLVMYGLDLLIVLLAIGAAVTANPERHPIPFARWQLLLPGVLAFAGTVILLSYPEIRDLANPEVWLVAAAGIVAGGARGWALTVASDRAHGLVRVVRGSDAVWVGWAMVLFAAIQGAIETGLRAENPYESTAEFFMLLASGYLLGRSAVAWLRARTAGHIDLLDA
ncbi:MAG: hypothetical protein J0J01_05695 [Reyranella sp.]|uniref:hypothetical protein n=1 Tax=Reyranella sp. TaxID=1929291 RepID=UPI001ACD61E7|nr:hypothetical protein [Reyranella sp.]MBN9086381.1 hypothetical protein [Reyranella sp.]